VLSALVIVIVRPLGSEEVCRGAQRGSLKIHEPIERLVIEIPAVMAVDQVVPRFLERRARVLENARASLQCATELPINKIFESLDAHDRHSGTNDAQRRATRGP
jgi:hypothetical protein